MGYTECSGWGWREAQRIRALVAPTEDLGSVPSTYLRSSSLLLMIPVGDLTSSSGLLKHQACMWCTFKDPDTTLTHK